MNCMGKEGERNKFGQQFFKVFFPEQSAERLRIPPLFHQYLQDQPTGEVALKGPSGNTWLVELASDIEGLFFVHGWREFLRDHSIERFCMLTFRYEEYSQFSVVIFDPSGTEKMSAFHAKPSEDLVVQIENGEGEMGMNAAHPTEILAVPPGESNRTTRKRIRDMDANISTLKKCSITLEKSPEAPISTYKAALTSHNMDMNAAGPSEVAPGEKNNGTTRNMIAVNGSTLNKCSSVLGQGKNKLNAADPSEILVVPSDKINVIAKKRVIEMDANASTLKSSCNVSTKGKTGRPGASVGTDNEASASLDRSSTDDYDCSDSMLEENIPRKKFAKSSSVLLKMGKNLPRYGKAIGKIQKQPTIISQRLPVTDEQKDQALKRAKMFKSKNPSTFQIMKESYVYAGFFMKIPCAFVRKWLPRSSKTMTLWDPKGKSWKVHYVHDCAHSAGAGAFSGGWAKFALGNHLEMFDVCVFELFSKDDMNVHIFRALPEITPFISDLGKE